ncbi:hypothetical protein D3C84_996590 [compost metagenome]
MTTTPIYTSLIDEQLDDIERGLAVIAHGIPFYQVIGKSPDFKVCDLTVKLSATQKGNRIAVRARP